jgi:hypothetical protein
MRENKAYSGRPGRTHGGGRGTQGRTVRLAFRGHGGARWTYSPTLIRSQPDSMEVSMLVPLRVGQPVEIEQPAPERAPEPARGGTQAAAPTTPAVRAQVTGCRCSADGLFRILLAVQQA